MRRWDKAAWWTAAALAGGALFFYRLGDMGMVGPDEPRYAAVARQMAQTSDWVTPRLWGQPWFEKPPLLYWMTAAAFHLGLGPDWGPRLPVACLSALFLLFFYWRMRAEFGPAAAGYGTTVLATSAGWVGFSHAAVFDVPLAATLGAGMLCLLGWVERGERRGLAAFAGLVGLSTLAKGLVGPVLAVLAVLAWGARMGWRQLGALARPAPALAFAAVALPWYVWCYARNGKVFLEEFIWQHHLARFGGGLDHNQPVWFFLPVLAAGLLPWTPLYSRLGEAWVWRERRPFFLLAWAGATVVFFSLSRDKLPGYVLPAMPALAALAGLALARESKPGLALPLSGLLLGLLAPGSAVLPAALARGLGEAMGQARFPLQAMVAVGVIAVVVWRAEHAGWRSLAIAAVALAAVVGYVGIKRDAFEAIDRMAGTRWLWREAQPHRDALCLGQVRRHVEYGMQYYAGAPLPRCESTPLPYRVENDGIVLSSK